MTKVLLSTNLIVEAILNRSYFFPDALNFFDTLLSQQIEAYISSLCRDIIYSLVNSEYFEQLEKEERKQLASSIIDDMGISVCSINNTVIQKVRPLNIDNSLFAMDIACALFYKLEGIVALEPNSFTDFTLPVFSPKQFGCEMLYRQKEPTNLSKWLKSINNSDWKPIEEIIPNPTSALIFRNSFSGVKLAKKIVLANGYQMILQGHILGVNNKFNIRFQLFSFNNPYLLENTRLFLLDKHSCELKTVKSRMEDYFIQIPAFRAKTKEEFSIRIEQDCSYHIENFIID